MAQIWATVSADAKSGEFYGPVGVVHNGSKACRNSELRDRLWSWMQGELKDHL